MERFNTFAIVLLIAYLVDTFTNTSKEAFERGYSAELKAGEYGSVCYYKDKEDQFTTEDIEE